MTDACAIRELTLAVDGNFDHWRNNQAVVEALASVAAADDLIFMLELPRQSLQPARRGLVVPIRGICIHRKSPVVELTVAVGGQTTVLRCRESRDEAAERLGEAGFANSQNSGFSGKLVVAPGMIDAVTGEQAQFQIRLGNGQCLQHTAAPLVADANMPESPVAAVTPRWRDEQGARVLIAMATFNPDTDAFDHQLASIREQTHQNWHLLINDDCSDAAATRHMHSCAASDDRISFRQNDANLGFYHNFETALRSVPASAQFIALSDQDDRWYPDKLERLLQAMQSDVTLSYCDMRVRNADGTVVSDSYWSGRNNNFEDLDVLLLANTVTGAASLFRRDLLETLLPFPPRIGDAFHDHWIACAALAQGSLGYIDAPLYDYVQHDDAVVGHCDFETPSATTRLRRLGEAIFRRKSKAGLVDKLMHARQSALAVFRFECRRIELICDSLLIRCPAIPAHKARALRLYGGGGVSGMRLLLKHLSVIRRGHSTNDAEVRLGTGYLVDALEYRRQRLHEWMGRLRRGQLWTRDPEGSGESTKSNNSIGSAR